jgi:hypothetical protein
MHGFRVVRVFLDLFQELTDVPASLLFLTRPGCGTLGRRRP